MTLPANTLPENSNAGYVAAAYIVFLALVLIYVAIMAIRLGRVERDIRTLKDTPHDGGREDAGLGAGNERRASETESPGAREDPVDGTLAPPQERTLQGTSETV